MGNIGFCGASLCEYCGKFEVSFVEGTFFTAYEPRRVRPPGFQEPGRSPRRRPVNYPRRRRTQRPRITEASARESNEGDGGTAQTVSVASGSGNMETTSNQH